MFSACVYSMVQVVPGRTVRSLVGDLERLFCVLYFCLLHGADGTWAECALPDGGPGEAVLCSLLVFTPWYRWYLGGVYAPWWGTRRGCAVFSACVYSMVQVVSGRSVRSLVGDLERLFCALYLCLLHGAGGTWADCALPGWGPGEAVLCPLLLFTPWCRWYLGGVCSP